MLFTLTWLCYNGNFGKAKFYGGLFDGTIHRYFLRDCTHWVFLKVEKSFSICVLLPGYSCILAMCVHTNLILELNIFLLLLSVPSFSLSCETWSTLCHLSNSLLHSLWNKESINYPTLQRLKQVIALGMREGHFFFF